MDSESSVATFNFVDTDTYFSFALANVNVGLNAAKMEASINAANVEFMIAGISSELNFVAQTFAYAIGKEYSTSHKTEKTSWRGLDLISLAAAEHADPAQQQLMLVSTLDAQAASATFESFKNKVENVKAHRVSYEEGTTLAISKGTTYELTTGVSHIWDYGKTFRYSDSFSYDALTSGMKIMFGQQYVIAQMNGTRLAQASTDDAAGHALEDDRRTTYERLFVESEVKFGISEDGIFLQAGDYRLAVTKTGITASLSTGGNGGNSMAEKASIQLSEHGALISVQGKEVEVSELGVVVDGELQVAGNVSASGRIASPNVVAGGVSLLAHVHPAIGSPPTPGAPIPPLAISTVFSNVTSSLRSKHLLLLNKVFSKKVTSKSF
ncbi:MAG: hypothetical protein M9924_13945 [Rhizobiaceae bacterium]|nr:hypothetical protein [Rhizobiaceae bacterium]